MAKVQITGGAFQDFEGNVLANGYLIFELNTDCAVTSVGQICHGKTVKVALDGSGNVSGTVLIWPNDQMVPTNNYYTVTGYTSSGQLAWGPNVQQIIGSSPFDLGTWVPNLLTNWTPTLQSTVLETNGTLNGNQAVLNLKNGSNITITDGGNGDVTVAASVPTLPVFKTNSVNNGSQSILNLKNGSNVAITDDGVGGITITANLPAYQSALDANSLNLPLVFTTTPPLNGFGAYTVFAMQMTLDRTVTINKATLSFNTGGGGVYLYAGIYNSAGNSLLTNFTFSAATTGVPVTVTLGSPLTLAAGTYWFAFSSDDTSFGYASAGYKPSDTQVSLLNAAGIVLGRSPNAMSGTGVLAAFPASLGTLVSPPSGFQIPYVVFA